MLSTCCIMLSRGIRDTVDGLPLEKGGVMSMYITLSELLAFCTFVIALIALVVKIKR